MRRKAFTLVEVMVALAVFAIVIVGVTTTVIFVTRMEKRSEYFSHFETICLDIDKYSDEYGRDCFFTHRLSALNWCGDDLMLLNEN